MKKELTILAAMLGMVEFGFNGEHMSQILISAKEKRFPKPNPEIRKNPIPLKRTRKRQHK